MATRPEVTGKKSGRRLLDYQALRERGIPWSRIHIGRLEAAGKFPLHIDLGENSIAWFEDEIDDHLEKKAAERDAKVAERAAKTAERDAKAGPNTDSECDRPSGPPPQKASRHNGSTAMRSERSGDVHHLGGDVHHLGRK
jgi:prophage regulatory protein